MNKSDTIGNLAKALALVQSQIKPAVKDSANPFFKSKYADLNSVWDACRDLLALNGLAVTQLNQITLDGVIVETVLIHTSGEWISGEMYLPLTKHDAQGVGSAITYGRRYGLAAIVGIVADEDDDGNAASKVQVNFNTTPAQVKSSPTVTPASSLNDRIVKAQGAILQLGGKFSKRAAGESDEDYFESLSDQYNRLKSAKEQV
jgi:hypothetical protein